MKFLFASDSFKGTLSSPKTAELLTQGSPGDIPGLCLRQHRSSRWAEKEQQKQYFQQSKEQQFP